MKIWDKMNKKESTVKIRTTKDLTQRQKIRRKSSLTSLASQESFLLLNNITQAPPN